MAATVRKIPKRQCSGCGEMKNKKELIRVVRAGEGEIMIDATGKKNGRGAYICPSLECFRKAVKNKGFERGLKAAVPEDIYRQLEEELINNGAK